jgi:hypothetical protein
MINGSLNTTMKYIGIFVTIFIISFSSCNQGVGTKTPAGIVSEKIASIEHSRDIDEIRILIRQALSWADSENAIDLLPAISDSTGSVYIGLDFSKVQVNLDKLEQTNFFSRAFISNYSQIMSTLDTGIKNEKYSAWLVGDIQTFRFANDVNPWCYCQELPYDKPSPWNLVEVKVISLGKEKGDLTWTWGQTDWPDIEYRFSVLKENGKWKISYMKGFDYNEGVKNDGRM